MVVEHSPPQNPTVGSDEATETAASSNVTTRGRKDPKGKGKAANPAPASAAPTAAPIASDTSGFVTADMLLQILASQAEASEARLQRTLAQFLPSRTTHSETVLPTIETPLENPARRSPIIARRSPMPPLSNQNFRPRVSLSPACDNTLQPAAALSNERLSPKHKDPLMLSDGINPIFKA